MKVPTQIIELIKQFNQELELYRSSNFNETQTRNQFIDPLFDALGWDLSNKNQVPEVYRDVVLEERLKISNNQKTKAPDYSFRIGGVRKFFVEAKKPAVKIDTNISASFQLRRYGWSAQLPISILTDFEEFAVYDCRIMPHKNDRANIARIKFYKYTEYVEKWTEIYHLFSKEAVLKGSLEKLLESKIKGEISVDQAFLAEIETWRFNLATNLVLVNPKLKARELNFAVQITINRIIFLRICEDRGIEPYEQLFNLLKLENIYQELGRLFINADYRYNSGLFHFQSEKGRESYDDFTLNLKIEDYPLREIIKKLYYPESPYEFSVIPVEILGQVYEQFLGKIINLSLSRQVIVEEKPEVRKAGGVYYTPSYIVDYIIEHTIGKLLENKKPEEIKDLTILDPSCGSGSFLIVAYQFLLDWYLAQYEQNKKKYKDKIYQTMGDKYALTSVEKKRILLAHIYGVDIDQQAVETTKLSLLLKVLEGESGERITKQLQLFKERALPDLDKNILSGNSLISSDYYNNIQLDLLDEDEMYRINVFDWEDGFPHVMKKGGFDVIIGNPPYGAFLSSEQIDYINQIYELQDYQLDSYIIFLEKFIKINLKNKGKFGMIIPNTWLLNLRSNKIRNYLFSQTQIQNIVNYHYPVFPKVTVDTQIVIIDKLPLTADHQIKINLIDKDQQNEEYFIAQKTWVSDEGKPVNILTKPQYSTIIDKLNQLPKLELGLKITLGCKPFQVGKGKPRQTRQIVNKKPFIATLKKDQTFRPLLRGSLINKYQIKWEHNYWISFGDWLAEPRYSASYDAPVKIVIRQTGDSLIATLDQQQFIVRNNLYTIILKPEFDNLDLKYFLGLLNSKLLNWVYQNVINPEKGEALAEVKRGHLAQLPIIYPEISNLNQNENYLKMIRLVDQMLALYPKLNEQTIPTGRKMIQTQIKATEKQIDLLVYQLYGLTEEEINIIEQS